MLWKKLKVANKNQLSVNKKIYDDVKTGRWKKIMLMIKNRLMQKIHVDDKKRIDVEENEMFSGENA